MKIFLLILVKGFASTENAQPFSAKPTIAFGNPTTTEKSATSFGSGLFNNLATTPFGTANNKPSVLFGSNTATPFGSQTSNAISIQKTDPAKSEKPSTIFDANVVPKSVSTVKVADKENAHKIEAPKPVIGGIVQEKTDAVQKPTAIQPILSNFGIASSPTVVATSIPSALSFGTISTTKDSSTAFNAISSGQSNEPPKSSFSIPLAVASTKPNVTNNVPVGAVVSTSSSSDFSFSLDKMGITPKSRL